MSNQEPRQLVAHAVIGLAVCIGGYMALVEPALKQAAAERAAMQEPAQQLKLAETLQGSTAAMTANLARLKQEEARIEEMGRPARDERDLFAAIMTLAAANRVRIDELNPMAAAPAAAKDAPAAARDAAVGYTMTATATYDDLTRFVRAVRTQLGYSVVRGMRVLPLMDDRVRAVRAVIETEHFAFDPRAAAPEGTPMAGAP
jgi:hypothetical protein